YTRTCPICGTVFTATARGIYCNPLCTAKAQTRRKTAGPSGEIECGGSSRLGGLWTRSPRARCTTRAWRAHHTRRRLTIASVHAPKNLNKAPTIGNTVALLYTRVSTDEQARDGLSLDAQLADCRRYAAQFGWAIHGEYQDVPTGKRDDRPQYQAML